MSRVFINKEVFMQHFKDMYGNSPVKCFCEENNISESLMSMVLNNKCGVSAFIMLKIIDEFQLDWECFYKMFYCESKESEK